jgi:murein DD-endopeptidase MepM/ murein hydrolase activator NlpD
MKRIFFFALFLVPALALGVLPASSARALTMKVSPTAPRPGDVLTITIWPHPGEKIEAVGMAAFDTPRVHFYAREMGTVRAYLGFPYDRSGGKMTLKARVQFEKNGVEQEQVVSTPIVAKARHFPTQRISMHNSNSGKMSQKAALRKEKELVQSKMKNSSAVPLWRGNWIVPVRGNSTSSYGRKRYVNGKWWGQHSGADIKAGTGTRVAATNSGRVVLSQYLPLLRGNCVVVDHGCNVFSIYMHLSKRSVAEGDTVAKGEKIGEVGATGFVTGPHLHWEMRIGWEPVDPFQFVRRGLNF